jgi:hypothetical protein
MSKGEEQEPTDRKRPLQEPTHGTIQDVVVLESTGSCSVCPTSKMRCWICRQLTCNTCMNHAPTPESSRTTSSSVTVSTQTARKLTETERSTRLCSVCNTLDHCHRPLCVSLAGTMKSIMSIQVVSLIVSRLDGLNGWTSTMTLESRAICRPCRDVHWCADTCHHWVQSAPPSCTVCRQTVCGICVTMVTCRGCKAVLHLCSNCRVSASSPPKWSLVWNSIRSQTNAGQYDAACDPCVGNPCHICLLRRTRIVCRHCKREYCAGFRSCGVSTQPLCRDCAIHVEGWTWDEDADEWHDPNTTTLDLSSSSRCILCPREPSKGDEYRSIFCRGCLTRPIFINLCGRHKTTPNSRLLALLLKQCPTCHEYYCGDRAHVLVCNDCVDTRQCVTCWKTTPQLFAIGWGHNDQLTCESCHIDRRRAVMDSTRLYPPLIELCAAYIGLPRSHTRLDYPFGPEPPCVSITLDPSPLSITTIVKLEQRRRERELSQSPVPPPMVPTITTTTTTATSTALPPTDKSRPSLRKKKQLRRARRRHQSSTT